MSDTSPAALAARADFALIAAALVAGPLPVAAICAATALPAWLVGRRLKQSGPSNLLAADRHFACRLRIWSLTDVGRESFDLPPAAPVPPPPPKPVRTSTRPSDPPRTRAQIDRSAVMERRAVAKRVMALPLAELLGEPPAPLPEPTPHLPGTPEKLAVIEARGARKQALFHPDDRVTPCDLGGLLSLFRHGGRPERTRRHKQ